MALGIRIIILITRDNLDIKLTLDSSLLSWEKKRFLILNLHLQIGKL